VISATDAAQLHYIIRDILSFNLSQSSIANSTVGHQSQQIFAIQQLQKFTDKEGIASVLQDTVLARNEPFQECDGVSQLTVGSTIPMGGQNDF